MLYVASMMLFHCPRCNFELSEQFLMMKKSITEAYKFEQQRKEHEARWDYRKRAQSEFEVSDSNSSGLI